VTAPDLASRTIELMPARGASRELVVAAVAVIFIARLVNAPLAWAVGACLLVAVALGTLQVLGETDAPAAAAGVPVESLILTSASAFAVFGAVRIVPIGVLLAPALLVGAWLIGRSLATEARILVLTSGPSSADRTTILVHVLVIAFLGFTGVAALVPGGLPEPGTVTAAPPTGAELAILATADAILAFLLGYRGAALRSSNIRDVAWFALTSAIVVAIAAVALRAMEIPRLLGPALLVLVFFLWDAVHGTPPSRRRDPRRIWETVLLLILGIAVAAWSVRLRG
jgi:hypothetical protein